MIASSSPKRRLTGLAAASLAALLVRKGLLKQEELDDEMDKLYEEMEKFDEE